MAAFLSRPRCVKDSWSLFFTSKEIVCWVADLEFPAEFNDHICRSTSILYVTVPFKSVSYKLFTIDTSQQAREGNVRGVFYGFQLGFIFASVTAVLRQVLMA